ncbi:MAG TPA: peptidoglycan DD-metalloendopeptidase family protein [Phototrophicaceae bacterium]|nr:peptidoglycan DD-metalloendopeptidase family protein [Phototrophicaceae bacterium]
MRFLKRNLAYRGLLLAIVLLLVPRVGLQAQSDGVVPPPASYEEVAESYAAAVQLAATEGPEIVQLFLDNDIETLYDRLAVDFQAQVTLEQLQGYYDQLMAVTPIGDQVHTRTASISGMQLYSAQHAWSDTDLALTAGFNEAGEVSYLNLQPVTALPEDPAADYESDVIFQLPFEGLWYTFWGGDNALDNYHVDAPPQRHAYDFVIWRDGSTFTGEGTKPQDYYVYGQTILAPAAGEVITVVNDLPDMQPQVETDAENPAGNHVVLQVAEDEYLFLAHMQPGSILVEEGDTVEAGQPIGLVGNSGNTSEPHLHIHLQNTSELLAYDVEGAITGFAEGAYGLPLRFSDYLANGEEVQLGEPVGSQFVQNAP